MRHYLSLIKFQGQYFHALDRISRGIINVQQQDLSLWSV